MSTSTVYSAFDGKGGFLSSWGHPGSADGDLNGPSGLAFDSQDNLYVVDSLNSRVQKFTKGGNFITAWGRHGQGDGELDMPWGICVDHEDNVYVADWRNNRVQKFSPDGKLLVKFEGSSSGVGDLCGACRCCRGLGRGRVRHRLGQSPAPSLRSRRAVHNQFGGRRSTAFALDPRLTSTLTRTSSRPAAGRTWSRNGASAGRWQ